MTDPITPTPAPAITKRAKPGFIEQELEDTLDLTEACLHEAAKPEVAPKLLEREWTPAKQTALSTSFNRCEDLLKKIREKRTGKSTLTDAEQAARLELLTALDPIIKGARRKYPDGSAERRAYGIGARLSSASLHDLYVAASYSHRQLAPGENHAAPKDTLPGVLPAEITAISQLADQYKNADFAQGDAAQLAAQFLAQLRAEVQTVQTPLRRDLQGAADQAYTHRNPLNAPQRTAFGLQPDRSLND